MPYEELNLNNNSMGIYLILNLNNNKLYIGSSINMYHRVFNQHVNSLSKNKHYNKYLQRAYNKDFEHFKYYIIEKVESNSILLDREQYWMDYYKCYDRTLGYNINVKSNGMYGYKHSDETKRKISENQIGRIQSDETKEKIRNANKGVNSYWYGKTKTKEHIYKITNSRIGFNHTKESKSKISEALKKRVRKKESHIKTSKTMMIPIVQLNKNGELIKKWDSATSVEREVGYRSSNIAFCCKGKRKSACGYIWMYESDYLEKRN